ncbi:MAG: hypothetical protein A2015_01250 [Spirochaetes bacterium GWF1_31_7]|nr:MAG: hypothetical protein A2Y30_00060 [Spirochaetes bacterium GWE1_32_154]OHD44717.1 MAG: hypothetical protein A2Y29_05730 [Spirochaetes bacterium GWE2_31_10]OHD51862.1 MAG: hypothetical protein A2015_01250 [Spirochaetes bacterium GWF1_31_7]OHD80283.1 MAG: hypothetical protein A2355_10215 [Spirochaetes bacterium RIFOXYB1_FULL_32_8]HBD94972.1 hypothetical protein [Spirochaetia bacterium]
MLKKSFFLLNTIALCLFMAMISCIPEIKPEEIPAKEDPGYTISDKTATVTSSEGLIAMLSNTAVDTINIKASGSYTDSYVVSTQKTIIGETGTKLNRITANTDNIRISKLTITSFVAGSGIGEGELTLEDVTIEEDSIFNGGGSNSIFLKGATTFKGDVTLNKSGLSLKSDKGVKIEKSLVILKAASLLPIDEANPPEFTGDIIINYSVSSSETTTINVKINKLMTTETVLNVAIGTKAVVQNIITFSAQISINNQGTITSTNNTAVISGITTNIKIIALDNAAKAEMAYYKLMTSLIDTPVDFIKGDFKVKTNITIDNTPIQLTWTSTDSSVIFANDGQATVSVPESGAANKEVKVKVSLSFNGITKEKEFTLTLIAKELDTNTDILMKNLNQSFTLMGENVDFRTITDSYTSNIGTTNLSVKTTGIDMTISSTKETTEGNYSSDVSIKFTNYTVDKTSINGTITGKVAITGGSIKFPSGSPEKEGSTVTARPTTVFTGSADLSVVYYDFVKSAPVTETIKATNMNVDTTSGDLTTGTVTYNTSTFDMSKPAERESLFKTFFAGENQTEPKILKILTGVLQSATNNSAYNLQSGNFVKDIQFPLMEKLLPALDYTITYDTTIKGWKSGTAKVTVTATKTGDTVNNVVSFQFNDYKNIDDITLNSTNLKMTVNGTADLKSFITGILKPLMIRDSSTGFDPYKELTALKTTYSGYIDGTITCGGTAPGNVVFTQFGIANNFVMIPPSMADIPMIYNASGTVKVGTKEFDAIALEEYVINQMPFVKTIEDKIMFKYSETAHVSAYFRYYSEYQRTGTTTFSIPGKVGGTLDVVFGTYKYGVYPKSLKYTNFQDSNIILNGTETRLYETITKLSVGSENMLINTFGKGEYDKVEDGYDGYFVKNTSGTGGYDFTYAYITTEKDNVQYYNTYYFTENTSKTGKFKKVTVDLYDNGYTEDYIIYCPEGNGDYDFYNKPYSYESETRTSNTSITFSYNEYSGVITGSQTKPLQITLN